MTSLRKQAAWFLAAWLAMADAFPSSIYPRESRDIETLAVSVWAYGRATGGNYPQSLEDIYESNPGPLVALTDLTYGALGDRYGFPNAVLTLPGSGRVLIMGTKPIPWIFGSHVELGRMVGYINLKDEPRVMWLPEEKAAALLASNPAVKLLTLGTKVTPPPYRDPGPLTEQDKFMLDLVAKIQRGEIPMPPRADGKERPALGTAAQPADPAPTVPAAKHAPPPPPTTSSWLKWLALAGAAAALALAWRFLRRK